MKGQYFADLSSYNEGFNAREYAKAGHIFVVIKATQGVGYLNPKWAEWTRDAHDNRIAVGHYHFADNTGTGVQQANTFLSAIRYRGLNVRSDVLILDLEEGGNVADPVRFRAEFESVLAAHHFHDLIVYSGPGYFQPHGQGLIPRSGKLWVADYGYKVSGWWWRHAWAWQFTDEASVAGVKGKSDYSKMNFRSYLFRRLHRPR